MALVDDLEKEIDDVLSFNWDTRDGQVVPTTDTVALGGGGVNLNATMLYADLADSTKLSMWNHQSAARIFKAFLSATSRLIKARGGFVRSFDGDRVMGVFLGDYKNTAAVKCGLQIKWTFDELLLPKFKARYEKIADGTYPLAYTTGIDTSAVLVARAGVRNDNDLIWVGRAPNIAAKLSAFRYPPYATWITDSVYKKMNDEAKLANGTNMWEARTWTNGPVSSIYRSSYRWKP